MARLFDDPNHKHYGPIRRLWIMLAQLDLLDAADHACDGDWPGEMSVMLASNLEEKFAQRVVLFLTLKFLEES